MNKKILLIFLSVLGVALLLVGEFFLIREYVCTSEVIEDEEEKPKAMMLLIEFGNTEGLVNMVNDMKSRNIHGVLMVNGDFIEKNRVVLKEVLKTGVIEIAPAYDPEPFWGMSYERQYEIISDLLEKSKKYLDITPRIISSRYMASDENTVKVAEDLGVEYITARGTTELATTVYQPEDYDVKIISVSNIDVPEFKYGSFCDYSFYERGGSPKEMTVQFERAIENEKFIGVSHTYIGGYKERWNNMWHNFWDSYEVDWVDLDVLGSVDKVMPMWQIPVNKNAPYTPEKIRPAVSYEDEKSILNPCLVEDLNEGDMVLDSEDGGEEDLVVLFHNNSGSMCLDMLAFLNEHGIEYEEHLNTETDFGTQLNSHKMANSSSEGVSTSYGYYPIIFVEGRAFSGFNSEVEKELLSILDIK
jgi:hypothetical protein